MHMKKWFVLSISISCYVSSFAQQYNFPSAKTVDSSDTYFDVVYKDPYRWLENLKDTEVIKWFKQQADLSNSILNKISGRDELIAECRQSIHPVHPHSLSLSLRRSSSPRGESR